jgi:hypothetical protein
MSEQTIHFSEAAIFGRMVEGDSPLSRELAERILALDISPDDRRRVDELLQSAREGDLPESDREELENLVHVADLLSLWHSKARRALREND